MPALLDIAVAGAQRTRRLWEGITIIALTGWGQDDDRRKSREAGFDGPLVKPVDYPALMHLLNELTLAASELQSVQHASARAATRLLGANGAATTFAELGNPLATDDYALCVYDGRSDLLFRMTAPAGGTCGTGPCWKQVGSTLGPKGYKYRSGAGVPDGVNAMALGSGLDGKVKMTLKGKGLDVPMPALGSLTLPLTTQLQSGDGQCWEMTTTTPSATTTTVFKAKGD